MDVLKQVLHSAKPCLNPILVSFCGILAPHGKQAERDPALLNNRQHDLFLQNPSLPVPVLWTQGHSLRFMSLTPMMRPQSLFQGLSVEGSMWKSASSLSLEILRGRTRVHWVWDGCGGDSATRKTSPSSGNPLLWKLTAHRGPPLLMKPTSWYCFYTWRSLGSSIHEGACRKCKSWSFCRRPPCLWGYCRDQDTNHKKLSPSLFKAELGKWREHDTVR